MWRSSKRKWVEPLVLAAGIPENETRWILLYSGMQLGFTGRHSLLALRHEKEIKAADFRLLARALSDQKNAFSNAWFGYLGYGLKDGLEKLPRDRKGKINLPNLWMLRFRLIAVFDHHTHTVKVHHAGSKELAFFDSLEPQPENEPVRTEISGLASNMSKKTYLAHVAAIRKAILDGDLYQANLTRKFTGSFRKTPEPFNLFRTLCHISPSPYSAYMRLGESHILSSSPERFLTVEPSGSMETRPIKGSMRRAPRRAEDSRLLKALKASEKNRAENLMIVDLMRNDFSKVCAPESIRVKSLFDITSYATVHHLSSTVAGKKRADASTLDAVKACFPPGSMTGAPKIQAMRLCTELEKVERGVYSGAIGWFGGDGSADLSVVIRTLVVQGRRFEFQVGGGIVADSVPQEEWEETLVKAAGLAKALGIPQKNLRKL